MKKFWFAIFLTLLTYSSYCQSDTVRALFLGNSYTAVNNLPQLVKDVATSAGDFLIYASNTPGGYTFQMHSTNVQSVGLIQQGGWDYMILQEQSQLPSFPLQQVETACYPYAKYLDSLFSAANNCGETVFYRTWGRKYGDADNCPTWPPVCTYSSMDSLLYLRYRVMSDSFNAVMSPVGNVWRYIRNNFPGIDLYSSDFSHPSEAGSYAAACCFYTILFRKSPSFITYNYTLTANDALTIRNSVKSVVYDSLTFWNVGKYNPDASFTLWSPGGYTVNFVNTSTNANSYLWDFGDGSSSTIENADHTYPFSGDFNVKLIAGKCNLNDSCTTLLHLDPIGIEDITNRGSHITPNPATSSITIQSPLLEDSGSIILITSLLGNTIISLASNKEKQQVINISALQPGAYYLSVKSKISVFNSLFIKGF